MALDVRGGMILRFRALQELTLCHVVGYTVEMMFLLTAACSKLMLMDAWSISVPFFLCICTAGDPLPVPRLRGEALAHSLGPPMFLLFFFFLHGCRKQSPIFHIYHHDNQGNVRFGPSHSQNVVRNPGLCKHNTFCCSYSQTAFHPWFSAWHSRGFKTVCRMAVRSECDQGWDASPCSPVPWWRWEMPALWGCQICIDRKKE